MSLSADPTFTAGSTGNIYGGSTGASLAASGSVSQTFAFGCSSGNTSGLPSSALSGRLQVLDFGGSAVATTNGLQVQLFSSPDGGTTYDTVAFAAAGTIATTASTTTAESWEIPPGNYKLTLTNLDATNAIKVAATLGTTG